MDLDVLAGSVATLRKNGYTILEDRRFRRSLETFGIIDLELNDPARAKQTRTTQRFRLRLITTTGEALPTKVEFSPRSGKDDYAIETIDPNVVRPYRRLAFECQHYAAPSAARQKILALANRPEVQARDAFDLYVLWLGGHTIDGPVGVKDDERSRAAENLMALDYPTYTSQVLDFLDPEVAEDYSGEARWHQMVEVVLHLLMDEAP